jgi:hypothetical protein
MSALGHKRTKRHLGAMSALPPKADKQEKARLALCPLADMRAGLVAADRMVLRLCDEERNLTFCARLIIRIQRVCRHG